MQVYLNLLKKIMTEGETVPTGAYLESEKRQPTAKTILAAQFRHNLNDGFPAVTTKKFYFDSLVKEILWFLRGETNVETLGCKIWDSWGGKNGFAPGECGPIYGATWRYWPYVVAGEKPSWWSSSHSGATNDEIGCASFDQIAQVVKDLKAVVANPWDRARRRIILSGWNPPLVPLQGLPPCHTIAQWLPTNGVLNCSCFWRSIDTPVGMPFNIAQYALLTHIFAAVAGLKVGELVATITDLHIYDNQFAMVEEQLTREPYPHPKLVLPNLKELAPELTMDQVRDNLRPDMFRLEGYKGHPPLKCEIAV